jgi:hypothetical protein
VRLIWRSMITPRFGSLVPLRFDVNRGERRLDESLVLGYPLAPLDPAADYVAVVMMISGESAPRPGPRARPRGARARGGAVAGGGKPRRLSRPDARGLAKRGSIRLTSSACGISRRARRTTRRSGCGPCATRPRSGREDEVGVTIDL